MIILRGNEDEILSVKLKDILLQVENKEIYSWKLLWLDGVSRRFNIGQAMRQINTSRMGYNIDFSNLVTLSDLSDQLYDVVLIGDKMQECLQKLANDNEMKLKYDFFIELVDGSYWEITSKDISFLNRIKAHFVYEER